jgi:hypothetical protein
MLPQSETVESLKERFVSMGIPENELDDDSYDRIEEEDDDEKKSGDLDEEVGNADEGGSIDENENNNDGDSDGADNDNGNEMDGEGSKSAGDFRNANVEVIGDEDSDRKAVDAVESGGNHSSGGRGLAAGAVVAS